MSYHPSGSPGGFGGQPGIPPPPGGFGAPGGASLSSQGGRRGPKGMSTGALVALIIAIIMVVLIGIGGILAVLGIYGTRKYISAAKSAEARNSLGMIARDAVAAYENEGLSDAVLQQGAVATPVHKLCPTAHPVPASVALIAGKKYQSATQDWEGDPGWKCLKYEMTTPQYYQYSYTSAGTSFTTVANGDLDADGTLSSFELRGKVENDRIVIAPQISETNPDE
jgi:type IV pilus assembly protein PilA